MGTAYTLGVIRNFTAVSNRSLSNEEWLTKLNERVDASLFNLETTEKEAKASLKPDVFRENISGFYDVLRTILGIDRNPNLDYYQEQYGTEIDNYQLWGMPLNIREDDGYSIKFDMTIALLFVEGKVMVEEFYTEPLLINWLFRNSNIDNKLTGCVASHIIG